MNLRPYQEKAISDLQNAVRNGSKAPLLVMPTGSGKTVVFSQIARNCLKKEKKVLILVHRKELIDQASKKLAAIDVKHGIIAANYKGKKADIQIASVQTLVRRLNTTIFDPNLIIIDEAHHAAAGSWKKIMEYYSSALKIGCTATPCRLDGKPLGQFFDSLVLGPTIPQLVSKGYLCPHKVYSAPITPNLSKVKTIAGDYAKNELFDEMVRADITGDAVKQYRKHADGLPAIAFCINIAHAESVKNEFALAGYKVDIITGSMKTEERDQVIGWLADGTIQVLVSVDVISEGTDCPVCACAILLRPTKSEGLYMQQVGRILRPKLNKTAIVLDHVQNTITHGFVDDEREWSLIKKVKRKKNSEKAPAVQTCKQCFACFPPQRICPCCGYETPTQPRELSQEDGELVELKREEVRQRVRERKREQGRQQTLQDLINLGRQRGYKPGWAYFVYNQRKNKQRSSPIARLHKELGITAERKKPIPPNDIRFDFGV
mgnify:CR=1 FL=1